MSPVQNSSPFMPVVSALAGGVLVLQVITLLLIVVLLVGLLTKKKNPFAKLAKLIGNNSLEIALLIAAIATVGSLTFSEILHFTPCKLCWFQRICMYPQVIILGVGVWVNDTRARIYALALSIIGLGIAIYHILVQFFPGMFQCSDEVANCALKQFAYFGYITIPVMSATAFAAIIIILLFGYASRKK